MTPADIRKLADDDTALHVYEVLLTLADVVEAGIAFRDNDAGYMSADLVLFDALARVEALTP